MINNIKYALLVLGLIFLNSCAKENLDSSLTVEEEFITAVVSCDLEVRIEENDPGRLTSVVTGGTEPYTYQWSTGETTADIIVDENGDYELIVADAEGCVVSSMRTVNFTDPCFGFGLTLATSDGTVLVAEIDGGTPPYQFSLNGGILETTSEWTQLAPGNYTVSAVDANGCTALNTITLSGDDPCVDFNLTVEVDNQVDEVVLTAVVVGGTPPYTYEWTTGETTERISVTEDGEYAVIVTDANGCGGAYSVPVVITDPCLGFEAQLTDSGGTSIVVTVSGGTAPYAYNWSDGSVGSGNQNLAPGTYSVTVVDSNGCIVIETITIGGDDPCDDLMATYSYDASVGALTIEATGGTAPYTYGWSTGDTTATINVSSGTYEVRIIDSVDCSIDIVIQIP